MCMYVRLYGYEMEESETAAHAVATSVCLSAPLLILVLRVKCANGNINRLDFGLSTAPKGILCTTGDRLQSVHVKLQRCVLVASNRAHIHVHVHLIESAI